MEVGWLIVMPSQGEEIWVPRLKKIELKKILMERMLAKLVDAVAESLNLDLD
ncbi:hypothetical protein U1Q18_017551 [Sarracenia purpurea var. burkii]